MGVFSLFKRRPKNPTFDIDQALGDFQLPALPGAAMQTLDLMRNPESSARAIAASIEINPALVVALLRLVNSAAFGLRNQVRSVTHAVALLGRSRLEPVVVATAVQRVLPRHTGGGHQPARFWLAACRRASVARSLAGLLHPQTASESFVAGLLQDMAVPLLAKAKPAHYEPLLNNWNAGSEASLDAMERSEFGWDHGDVGASMAQKWALPLPLIQSIDAHHLGEGAEPAVRLVGILRESDAGEGEGVDQLVEVCRADYNLAPDGVVSRLAVAFEEAAALAPLFA